MRQVKPFRHQLITESYRLQSQDTPNGRFYALEDGRKIPSVTTVLGWKKKESLLAWRERVGEEEANRISRKAAARGTRVHNVCEAFLLNKENYLAGADFITMDMFGSIYPILRDRLDDLYSVESALYSEYLGLAGRVDCIGRFDGKKSIVDFKTSSKPKKQEWISDYFMQTACYAVMFEERTGIAIPNLVIIIAVENDLPQVFIQKRDDWVAPAQQVIKEYYDYHLQKSLILG
jgi:genome maintenance exonuclease 1